MEQQFAYRSNLRHQISKLLNNVHSYNIKDTIYDLFELNLLIAQPLVAGIIAGSDPILGANIVAVVNSELPDVGKYVMADLLSTARAQVLGSEKEQRDPRLFLLIIYLFKLRALDSYCIFQILICLVHEDSELAECLVQEAAAELKDADYECYELVLERLEIEDKFPPEDFLDLVVDEHKRTQRFDIDDLPELSPEFSLDREWSTKQKEYSHYRAVILGEEASPEEVAAPETSEPVDMTGRELVSLQKSIYLTIMSTMSAEEACHKLLKMPNLHKESTKKEVVRMIVRTCGQEKIYSKGLGNIAGRLSRVSPQWREYFEWVFREYYETLDEFDTKFIRNIGTLFGSLMANDSIQWTVFDCVSLYQDESTPSNRIFLQSMFEEIVQELGIPELKKRLEDPSCQESTSKVFPMRGPTADLQFSINFFTAIELGPLTDAMRAELKARKASKS